MINLKYVDSETIYDVNFSRISQHVVQVLGNLPFLDKGFILSRNGKNDKWDYSNYVTLYRKVEGGLQLSDDGSVYVVPVEQDPIPDPEPYIPTLDELREMKVIEMNIVQENVIQAGIEVTLKNGTVEHFDLTEKERNQLAILQTMIARGDEKIPWHTSDEAEHGKYYSNDDMIRITTAAFEYVTYHETYFRDLRIYIRSLNTKEEVENVTYGIDIPKKFRSQPLDDMLANLELNL